MRLRVTGLGAWLPHSGVAFEAVNLTADAGEIVLIAGPNGSGASTLLATVAGLSVPGQRRVGKVRYDTHQLAGAHPDELSTIFSLVGEGEPATGLTVADLVAGSEPDLRNVVQRLGLEAHLQHRLRALTESQRMRARLSGMLLRRAPVLLLDQVLGPLESIWRHQVCALVREFADGGGLVLWADQHHSSALEVVDRIVALGLVPAAAEREAVQPRRGSLVPVEIGGGRPPVMVDDTAPPVFVCDSEGAARACRATLMAANGVVETPINSQRTVRLIAKDVDRVRRLSPGSTLADLQRAVPALRPDSALTWHSRGEQALLRNVLTLGVASMRLLYEPFRYLDGVRVASLVERIHLDWLAGSPTLVVTTDLATTAWFDRVIVWRDNGVTADGRASAIGDALPAGGST